MSFPMDILSELEHALTLDDFENFVSVVNETGIILDKNKITKVAQLVVTAAEKSRSDFFDFLLPLLSCLHLYKALQFIIISERSEISIYKLIENGAPLDALHGTQFFYNYRPNLKMMKFVLDKGLDPNTACCCGINLLSCYLIDFHRERNSSNYFSNGEDFDEGMEEAAAMLLYYGADTSNIGNDYLRVNSRVIDVSDFVFEQLFLHTFDDTPSRQSIQLATFLAFVGNAKNHSGDRKCFIDKLLDYELEFVMENDENRPSLFRNVFFTMNFNTFKIITRKFPKAICTILEEAYFDVFPSRRKRINRFLKKMEYLVTKEVFFNHVVKFFEKVDTLLICYSGIEVLFFMIQYGLKCDTSMYHTVYKKYGDCALFRTLLHLDVRHKYPDSFIIKHVMSSLISDINLNVQDLVDSITEKKWYRVQELNVFRTILKTPYGYLSEDEAIDLLDFFIHPKLTDFLLSTKDLPERVFRKIELLPRVPSMHELARDILRKHIVTKFHVSTTKQFYSIVDRLPIPAAHRKIITFETKLYDAIVLDSDL